jgi:hypothetical protein
MRSSGFFVASNMRPNSRRSTRQPQREEGRTVLEDKMTKEIYLTKGMVTLVDDEDYIILSKFNWQALKHGGIWYAVRSRCRIYMHREIMKTPSNMVTDHINHDGLDNRRCNLRICTQTQNQYNREKHLRNTSGYKGVTWDKSNHKWRAQIRHDGVYLSIGYFRSVTEAALAYNNAAIKYHGEFAKLNELSIT